MLSTTYAEEADALNMQTQKKPFQPTFPIFPFRSLIDKNAFFSAIFFFFLKKKGSQISLAFSNLRRALLDGAPYRIHLGV